MEVQEEDIGVEEEFIVDVSTTEAH